MNRLVIAFCALVMGLSSNAALQLVPPEQTAASTPAAPTIYLVRHGHYAAVSR